MVKKVKKLMENQKGFTLVELLAVIVILGIIAAIAIPSIGNIIDNSKKDAHVANAQQLVNAARMGVASNQYKSGDAAVSMATMVQDGYLESTIKDPDSSNGSAYTTAQVVIGTDSTTKAVTYTVTLIGSKRQISGVLSGDLSRTTVTAVPAVPAP